MSLSLYIYELRIAPDRPRSADCRIADCNNGWCNLQMPQEKRLEAFLQFHEQKTVGIPGLNILYEGMRARVTEKIVKGRHIKILKHTPCTVIGWDLHAIDRKSIFG